MTASQHQADSRGQGRDQDRAQHQASHQAQQWFFPRGSLRRDGWESVVDGSIDGWAHTGIRVGELAAGGQLGLNETGVERIVIPLAGSFTVEHTEGGTTTTTELTGRASVFAGATDVLYLSAAASGTIRGQGRVAVATSPTDVVKPTRYMGVGDIPVELRGAGNSSRQIHNFGTVAALDAARFIVCEVITPAGNWSSYPPHKHDEHVPGKEAELEEIYYFEAAPVAGARGAQGDAAFGMFATYSSPAGEINTNAMVRSGDIALVPFGFHGPAAAAPGYDMYYLNVMAGPSERIWNISDDPAYGWVRQVWDGQQIDPRLPFSGR